MASSEAFYEELQLAYEDSQKTLSFLRFYEIYSPQKLHPNLAKGWSLLVSCLFQDLPIPKNILDFLAQRFLNLPSLNPKIEIEKILLETGVFSDSDLLQQNALVLESFHFIQSQWIDGSMLQKLKNDFLAGVIDLSEKLNTSIDRTCFFLKSIGFRSPYSLTLLNARNRFCGSSIDFKQWLVEIRSSFRIEKIHTIESYIEFLELKESNSLRAYPCESELPKCHQCSLSTNCNYFGKSSGKLNRISAKILTGDSKELDITELNKLFNFYLSTPKKSESLARSDFVLSYVGAELTDGLANQDLRLFKKLIDELIARKHTLEQSLENPILNSSDAIFEFVRNRFIGERQELFCLLILNSKNKLIKFHYLTKGLLDQSLARPREVFQIALELNAASLILLHNHPSGDPTPSPQDKEITKKIARAGRILGVEVLDHIIIGDDDYFSFTDEGLIV